MLTDMASHGWRGVSTCRWGFQLAVLLVAAWPANGGAAGDWERWRGVAGHGTAEGSGFPTRWDPAAPVWKVKLPGKGGSCPVIRGDRIYLTTPAEGEDAVLALNSEGKELWRTRLGPLSPARHATLGSSCNATPALDESGVYAYFKSGRLVALDHEGGVRWKQDLTERFGPEKLYWDQGTSPMLTDRHVILARMHGGESWIAAFDKKTGEMAWRVARTFPVPAENDNGYSTPVLFRNGDQPALLVWGSDRLTAHAVGDGRVLWSCEGFNPQGTANWPAIASPVVVGDLAIVPVGRDDRPRQARVHAIRLGGSGDVTSTHRAWVREDVGVFVTSPSVADGRVYLLRHRGEVVCLEPATGRTVWAAELPRASAPFYASPLVAGGILYAAREDGVVFTARVGASFERLSEMPMGERIVSSPVPLTQSGRILLRGDAHLFCVGGDR